MWRSFRCIHRQGQNRILKARVEKADASCENHFRQVNLLESRKYLIRAEVRLKEGRCASPGAFQRKLHSRCTPQSFTERARGDPGPNPLQCKIERLKFSPFVFHAFRLQAERKDSKATAKRGTRHVT